MLGNFLNKKFFISNNFVYFCHMIIKIISGGQTGVDRIGLEVGRSYGLKTGGTAPKGFRTENGYDYSLMDFGLVEHSSYRYEPRTEVNVINSDGTVLYGNMDSSGSKLTIKLLKQHTKPYLENPSPEQLKEFVINNNIKILNVAGNRSSKLSVDEKTSIVNKLKQTLELLK